MIPVKVLASILLFLTFIHAFPSTLEPVDDPSIQRSDLVVRQTAPPVSIAATEPGSLNLTGLVDTFGDLVVDLKDVGGVLQNLTETLKTDLSDVSGNFLHFVLANLSNFIQNLSRFIGDIEDRLNGLFPNGPFKELFDAFLESLKSLLGSLDNLEDALSDFSVGNLNSLRSLFKALKGAVNALIVALAATTKLVVIVKTLDKVPSKDLNQVLNDLVGLSGTLAVLKGVLGVLGAGIGLAL